MTTTDPDAERHAAELVQALHGYREIDAMQDRIKELEQELAGDQE